MGAAVCSLILIPGLSSFPAQSARQLLSLQWSCSPRSVTHCTRALPLASFFTPGKEGTERGRPSLQRGSAALFTRCLTRVTFDWRIQKNMSLIVLSRISPDRTRSTPLRAAPPSPQMHGGVRRSPSWVDDAGSRGSSSADPELPSDCDPARCDGCFYAKAKIRVKGFTSFLCLAD